MTDKTSLPEMSTSNPRICKYAVTWKGGFKAAGSTKVADQQILKFTRVGPRQSQVP